ncbi:MAG: glycosyl transferase family 1, partial [Bacteroidia bacterium]|nr:glycosyl transferase family 1 [Bacteroidia bacterium]
MACVKALVQKHNVTAHIVRYPINPTAPFQFEEYENVQYYERNDFNQSQLSELTKKIKPAAIICAGWSDKLYLNICKEFNSKTPTVLTFDNPWTGSLKQKVYSTFAPLYFKKIFSHVWVPGANHKIFAQKLGFSNDCIHTGLY